MSWKHKVLSAWCANIFMSWEHNALTESSSLSIVSWEHHVLCVSYAERIRSWENHLLIESCPERISSGYLPACWTFLIKYLSNPEEKWIEITHEICALRMWLRDINILLRNRFWVTWKKFLLDLPCKTDLIWSGESQCKKDLMQNGQSEVQRRVDGRLRTEITKQI
jgi:hypothetical protein